MILIPSFLVKPPEWNSKRKDDRTLYQDYFSQELGLDALMEANPENKNMLRKMQELRVDTLVGAGSGNQRQGPKNQPPL